MPKDEKMVWKQYDYYLSEATGRMHDLSRMRNLVRKGCDRQELKELMLKEFVPQTIMQGLEQWECMMDLLMYTKLPGSNGMTRMELRGKDGNSRYSLVDDVIDSSDPAAHIYDLSGKTQDTLFIMNGVDCIKAPESISKMISRAELEHNWELMMLLGDAYRRTGDLENARATYSRLKKESGNIDRSIQDAINSIKLFEVFYKNDGTYHREHAKVGRNDPCPCGSGKKYKQCCGKI